MARHRSHSVAFKRQVAEEYLAGETLHGLAKRHDISRNLIRIWVAKYEAGAFDEDAKAADLLQAYEARIGALEPAPQRARLQARRRDTRRAPPGVRRRGRARHHPAVRPAFADAIAALEGWRHAVHQQPAAPPLTLRPVRARRRRAARRWPRQHSPRYRRAPACSWPASAPTPGRRGRPDGRRNDC